MPSAAGSNNDNRLKKNDSDGDDEERPPRFSRIHRPPPFKSSLERIDGGGDGDGDISAENLDDSQYAEQASSEMFSGPASESVPSSYSSFHMHGHDLPRRLSSRSRSSHRNSEQTTRNSFADELNASMEVTGGIQYSSADQSDSMLSSSVLTSSVGSLQNNYLHRGRSESRSSFRFFSWDEIENAQGATTAGDDMDPVIYDDITQLTDDDIEFDVGDYHHHHSRRDGSTSQEEVVALSPILRHHRYSQADAENTAVAIAEEDQNLLHSTEEVDLDESQNQQEPDRRYLPRRRRSSHFYEDVGADEPLLEAGIGGTSSDGRDPRDIDHIVYTSSERLYQRYYITEEDLVIGFAGFKTSRVRSFLYTLLCIVTCGLAFLILRWFPRLRISCIGKPAPLGQCDWVVVENQWGELTIVDVSHKRYNQRLSTIFRQPDDEKSTTPATDVNGGIDNRTQGQVNKRLTSDHEGTPSSRGGDDTPIGDNSSVLDDDFYIDNDPMVPSLRWIEYRYIKFFFHPFNDIFLTNYNWVDPAWKNFELISQGLDSDVQLDRDLVFGQNLIDIKEKTTVQLLVDEVLHPFYVFQVFSMILWAFDEYYYYASCIFLISVISVGNTLVETKQALSRLSDIAKFVCDVRVLRSGFWTTIPSSELIPGDVYELSDPNISSLPCDSILLSGDCIVNESMLTGESVPVSKIPVTEDAIQEMIGVTTNSDDNNGNSGGGNGSSDLSKHYLYSGTKIIRVRRPKRLAVQQGDEDYDVALALVLRTGFSTTKGSLVRSMLFPKPSGFKFYADSFKYIGFMSIIAIIGFTVCTINFIRMKLSTHLIVFRALDMITIVVPPALPATLTIGTNISLARLRKKSIFCISPNRVNVGGKLDIMCFDKTGTLTEDGLDVLGIHLVGDSKIFSALYNTIEEAETFDQLEQQVDSGNNDLPPPRPMTVPGSGEKILAALTTCHSLRSIDDELIGDPLDAKMFDFTGWNFKEEEEGHHTHGGTHLRISTSPDGRTVYTTLKTFEFVSQLRRMSVLARAKQDGSMYIFLKGAPEVMDQVCDPSTFPADYKELLHRYTHRGYRVIAVAAKKIIISDDGAKHLKREEAEKNMEYIGFIIFENKIKESTGSVIQELSEAKIRTVMCTGDNVLTAISVARECHIIPEKTVVFAAHFVEPEEDDNQTITDGHDFVNDYVEDGLLMRDIIRWECIDDPSIVLNAQLRPVNQQISNYTLAVTGDIFRYIVKLGSVEQLEQILIKGSIFARMSPDEKHELVEKLQAIGYTAGFCGDGANDCGALKAADVGISLSEAEASVAAPFTSRKFEIDCVLDVIKEGRCALATSFSCFKYMSLYSAIQFVSVSILYGFGSNLGDFQFLWIDLFLILPIAIFMAWAKPFPVLSPKRPTANLVSRKVLIPLIGEIIILGAFQMIVWVIARAQPWYLPPKIGGEDSEVASTDNTALFMTSCFQYIFTAVVLSVGPPYREPIYKNVPFLITIGASIGISVVLLFLDGDSWFGRLMTLSYTSIYFKGVLLAFVALNGTISWVADRIIFPMVAHAWMRLRKLMGYRKIRKRYKVLNDELARAIV